MKWFDMTQLLCGSSLRYICSASTLIGIYTGALVLNGIFFGLNLFIWAVTVTCYLGLLYLLWRLRQKAMQAEEFKLHWQYMLMRRNRHG